MGRTKEDSVVSIIRSRLLRHFQDAFGVIYNHTHISQNPLTYNTECYVDIPIAALYPGRLYYNISISPDINVVDKVQKAGVIIEANASLEMPKLFLSNCPGNIQDIASVHCVCARDNTSDIDTSIFWTASSNDSKQTDRIAILSTVKKDTDYFCIARNEFGWMTVIQYRPTKTEPHFDATIVIIVCVSFAISDVAATCNKQPEDSYEESSVDEYDCSEKEKHENFISCEKFFSSSDNYLTTHNVFNEIETVKKFILCTIDLTVKLNVRYVSKNRTQNDRLSKQRGESFTLTGTGRVVKVKKSDKPCNCPKHISEGGCSTWTVDIATTTHVVFDETEAKCTTVELFGDDDMSGVKNKSLHGKWFHKTDQPGECVVQCETCDKDLNEKLASTLTEQRELSKKLPFTNDTFFIISHLHGKSKHICFGRRTQVKDCSDVICPGCYGAYVLTLHRDVKSGHSGYSSDGEGYSPTSFPDKVPLLKSAN